MAVTTLNGITTLQQHRLNLLWARWEVTHDSSIYRKSRTYLDLGRLLDKRKCEQNFRHFCPVKQLEDASFLGPNFRRT